MQTPARVCRNIRATPSRPAARQQHAGSTNTRPLITRCLVLSYSRPDDSPIICDSEMCNKTRSRSTILLVRTTRSPPETRKVTVRRKTTVPYSIDRLCHPPAHPPRGIRAGTIQLNATIDNTRIATARRSPLRFAPPITTECKRLDPSTSVSLSQEFTESQIICYENEQNSSSTRLNDTRNTCQGIMNFHKAFCRHRRIRDHYSLRKCSKTPRHLHGCRECRLGFLGNRSPL